MDAPNEWKSSNEDVVALLGDKDKLTIKIRGDKPGSVTLSSPKYRIKIPDEEGGDKVCLAEIQVVVGRIQFIDEMPSYALEGDSDSDNFFLRQGMISRNLISAIGSCRHKPLRRTFRSIFTRSWTGARW